MQFWFAKLKEMILEGKQGCVQMEEFNFSDSRRSLQGSCYNCMPWARLSDIHMSCKECKVLNTRTRPRQNRGNKLQNCPPKSPAQLMLNPGGNEVLFLGCQHLKIQDILPFTYPQPPHAGQLCACLPPGPSAGIRSSDTFPCKTRPRAAAA